MLLLRMPFEQSTTAILVAYNSEAVIASALQSLVSAPEIAQVIVVDNCSVDNTIELIRRDFPGVTVIENPRNDGFGPGNNIGLKKVTTPYALLVNPDAVMQPGSIAELLRAAEDHPDAAILGPYLADDDGTYHQSFKHAVFRREKTPGTFTMPEGDCCAEFLSGAVMLWNMRHMKKVGFFDPQIFLFYEDDDICLRVRAAGLGLVYVPSAKVMHLMGASSGEPKPESEFFRQRHMIWSRLYLEEKYRGVKAGMKLARKLELTYSIAAAFYTLRFNKKKLNRYRGRLRGIFEFNEARTPAKAA